MVIPGSCKWDRKRHRVACNCFAGFAGHLCDACEDSTAVFPLCQTPSTPACKCDPRGVVDPNRVCDEACECKVSKTYLFHSSENSCLLLFVGTSISTYLLSLLSDSSNLCELWYSATFPYTPQ